MIQLIATLALLAPPTALQEPAPDRARIDAAVKDLQEAYEAGDANGIVSAIQRSAQVVDAEVIEEIAKGLRSREMTVRDGSIEALRFMAHPDALAALDRTYRRDRAIKKEPEAYARLIRAIGQHGNEESIELVKDVWDVRSNEVITARIYALGHIRSEKSVKALMDAMKSGGRRNTQPHMGAFRTSLMVLTGDDQGKSQDLWLKWWNENKRSIEVASEEPALPKKTAQRWAYYWGRDRVGERPQKRGDRGRD